MDDQYSLMNRVRDECRIWTNLVNKHIPRLREWDENKERSIIIARSELADLGHAGKYDRETSKYILDERIYELFLNKIINEDRILRKLDVPNTFTQEISPNNNLQKVENDEIGKILEPSIKKRLAEYNKQKALQKDNKTVIDYDGNCKDQVMHVDELYDSDDLKNFQINTQILNTKERQNMTKDQAKELNVKEKWNRDIEFHKELRDMPKSERDQFVVGRIFFDVCVGLYYMHLWKIAHLDVKYDNFVISSKDNGTAMLIDFNNARLIEDENERIKDMQGAKAYEAPEYDVVGRSTPFRYDMFSLGVLLYALYFGDVCSDDKNWEEEDVLYPDWTPYPIKELLKG